MPENQSKHTPWSDAERDSLRNLLKMVAILFMGIIAAGTVAAFISSALGTL